MQLTQQPTLVPLAFAAGAPGGDITPPPLLSQIGIANGRASLTDGFPPLCFTPVTSGGVPPFGADFNGIHNLTTQHSRWSSAGGGYLYSSAFAVLPQVGGYPRGAVLISSGGGRRWMNQLDGNMTDPDGFASSAAFTGSCANVAGAGVLTVPSAPSSGTIVAGQQLSGAGVAAGVYVTGQLTGTPGGAGTYSLSQATGTIASEAMTTGSANWTLVEPLAPGSQTVAAAQTLTDATVGTTYFQTSGGIAQALPAGATMPHGIEFDLWNVDGGGAMNVSSADGFAGGLPSPQPVTGAGANLHVKWNKTLGKWMIK